jgi:osmoprotectant transport system ATP-binding protein
MLEHPPIVALENSLVEARRQMAAAGAHWALVASPGDERYGELLRADTNGSGTVAERVRWVDARVSAAATLRDALSEMLLHDAGWVAVVEGERLAGVLTPASLQTAMRGSLREQVPAR